MATVKLTRKKTIDHEDADAAGFTGGYWWQTTNQAGDSVESGAPTRDAALEAAAAAAGVDVAELDVA